MSNTTRISARFKGQDGSRGYATEQKYDLDIWHAESVKGRYERSIFIKRAFDDIEDSQSVVEYESITALLNNWNDISW